MPTHSPSGTPAKHRVSRACVACRSRKTRCDLTNALGDLGDPPCRRCLEKNISCILATSQRGGRRVKGQRMLQAAGRREKNKLPPASAASHQSEITPSSANSHSGGITGHTGVDSIREEDSRHIERPIWLSPQMASDIEDDNSDRENSSGSGEGDSRGRLEGHITSANLLNPSDALDLLAQVAHLDPQEDRSRIQASDAVAVHEAPGTAMGIETGTTQAVAYYPPISSGAVSMSEAATLLQNYYDRFHIYFPIAHKAVFEDTDTLSERIEKEEHLITAILTVVTKDDPVRQPIHEACARHMESLISKLIYAGSTNVGAVESLLILAEWAPQSPEDNFSIGTGKEDQGSWMLVGLAVRLAYLQNLEQTTLSHGQEGVSEHVCRQRTVWAACYMSDRQVSIRLGKGFWSRGPGPTIALRATDFPLLHAQKLGNDSLAMLFQAHLEITQLFSNAHDILYSSAGHREQLYAGGEYVRYIDDLAAVLRGWKLSWGGLSFVPLAKASLMLSYHFLRLYINAFAFQANLHRAIRRARRRMPASAELKEPLFSDLAGTPDARFIYESIDAANSLLSLLNSYIDAEMGLKFMPLKFYLYIIYAAVFLFKAIASGAIKSSAVAGIRRAIHETIVRLQRTSTHRQSLGQRYAQSLRLLWQKALGRRKTRSENAETPVVRANASSTPTAAATTRAQQNTYPSQETTPTTGQDLGAEFGPFSNFWWKSLNSLGQFVMEDLVTLPTDGIMTNLDPDSAPDMVGLSNIDAGEWYNTLPLSGDVIL